MGVAAVAVRRSSGSGTDPAPITQAVASGTGGITSLVLTLLAGVPIGSEIILALLGNSGIGSGSPSATDTAGNTYVAADSVVEVSTGALGMQILRSKTTALLHASDTVTASFASVGTDAIAHLSAWQHADNPTAVNSTDGASGSPSVSHLTMDAIDLVYGAIGSRIDSEGTISLGAGWTALASVIGPDNVRGLYPGYKIVHGSGISETFTGTPSGSGYWVAHIGTYPQV